MQTGMSRGCLHHFLLLPMIISLQCGITRDSKLIGLNHITWFILAENSPDYGMNDWGRGSTSHPYHIKLNELKYPSTIYLIADIEETSVFISGRYDGVNEMSLEDL